MFMERLIRGSEVHKFEDSLLPHQKATGPDGSTVLERAVLQHNVLAASRVYKNMRLPQLGHLLEVAPENAEKIAAKMIAEKRLAGFIDQKSGVIHFEGGGDDLQQWDRHIRNVCTRTYKKQSHKQSFALRLACPKKFHGTMAKRLVMGPSPGTGLFVHEPRASKSRYSRESKDDGKSMADQEEEKINGRLVEILERKCAKLRSRAEQEEKNRKTLQEELEDRKLSCDRDAKSCNERFVTCERRMRSGVAQQALQDRDVELRQLQEQQARSEEQWKAQIVKLVEEMRRAEQKSSTLAKDHGRRLELEERCLQLEEKLKTREQRTRNDADCAHKLKQCQQAKEVAEQQAKENEERSQKAAERLEEVESRQKDLEAEVQRLKLQCSEKSRRIEELEAASVQEMEPLGPSGPPRPPIPRSRPGTASSAGSASVGTSRVGAGDSRSPVSW
eukprot:g15651.t1